MKTIQSHTHNNRQHGSALITSLVFLIILTILGLSAIGNAGLNARMSHNFQLSHYVYQATESGFESVIKATNIPKNLSTTNNPHYKYDNDPLAITINGGTGSTNTVTFDPDPNDHMNGATATSVETQYVKPGACYGYSFNDYTCHRFVVNSTARIDNTGATSTHTVGIDSRMLDPK